MSAEDSAPSNQPPKFREGPFTYHQEVEVEIATLTNLGDGLGRVDGWVVSSPAPSQAKKWS
jgi:23S rRNA (uracil1939-C5)-methyltransferase/tRNA (uracil-5-)-methyltransferase